MRIKKGGCKKPPFFILPKIMRYSSKLLICLCLTLAIVLVYGQVIDFDFIGFDDELYVTKNLNVQKGFTAEGVKLGFYHFSFS